MEAVVRLRLQCGQPIRDRVPAERVLREALQVAAQRQEELPQWDLPQLATRVQRRTGHVRYSFRM